MLPAKSLSLALCSQGTKETGSFSVIKANDNSGKGLAAGMSNKKLSAAQLAAAQQAVTKANEMSAKNVTGPVVLGSQDGYEQASHPSPKTISLPRLRHLHAVPSFP